MVIRRGILAETGFAIEDVEGVEGVTRFFAHKSKGFV